VAELTLRYFKSHGPAQLQDFVWWSGLTMADARRGIALAGQGLEHQTIDGKEYWFDAGAGRSRDAAGAAHLLPNFDEYTVAFRDRAEVMHTSHQLEPALVLSNIVTVGGKIRGTWRRTLGRNDVSLEIHALDRLNPSEMVAVEQVASRFGRYLELPVHLSFRGE
jgi:hypothetical protein